MAGNQAHFGTALLDAEAPRLDGISDGHGGPAAKRFDVYRNNVVVSLGDALSASFPVVLQLVGEEFFKAMAAVALRQYPPQSPLMAEYGAEFPTFLENFPPVAHLPYLADVARVEHAVRQAYHAADAAPLTAEGMNIPPEDFAATCFHLAPAVQLLQSPYPVATLWLNHQPDAEKAAPNAAEDVLISRPEFDPFVDPLPAGAFAFLSALDGTTPLGEALDAAPEGFDFPATLGLCLTRGVLVSSP